MKIKKGRYIGLDEGSYVKLSTASTRFSVEMNVRSLEKEKGKGKGKEKMDDQMKKILEDNRYFKKKYEEIFDMYQDMMKTFLSQSNTTPQPSDHGSLQDKSNAGQSDRIYQTLPFK